MAGLQPNTQPKNRAPQRTEQRKQRVARGEDPFWYDDSKRPDGMVYQWVVETILGQPDTQQAVPMAMNHWTPVPMSRHSEIVGPNAAAATPDAAIRVNGLVLCEREAYLQEEARLEEERNARSQLRNQAERLALAGPEERLSAGAPTPRTINVNRGHEATVPEDA